MEDEVSERTKRSNPLRLKKYSLIFFTGLLFKSKRELFNSGFSVFDVVNLDKKLGF